MKKVKFNASTSVHMIPDDKMAGIKQKLGELELEDMVKYNAYLNGMIHRFKFQDVKIDQVIEVPDWYYQGHKDQVASQGVSFDHYRDKLGNRSPFDMEEALRHGDVTDPTKTMKQVKLFDLIDDQKKSIRQ